MKRLILLAFLGPFACTAERAPNAAVVVTDSGGLRLVTNVGPAHGTLTLDGSMARIVTTIGDDAASPAYEFTRIAGGAGLADGGLAIIDQQSRELRIFDRDGSIRVVQGGRGDGPGEFRQVSSIHRVSGDTLVVYDRGLGRATRFTPDAELVNTVSFVGGGVPRAPDRVWPLGGGSWLLWESRISDSRVVARVSDAEAREYRQLLRLWDGGERFDTLASEFVGGSIHRDNLLLFPPFGGRLAAAVNGTHVAFGDSRHFQVNVVQKREPAGTPTQVRFPAGEVPLTDARVAFVRDSLEGMAREAGVEFMYGTVFADRLLPSVEPAFSDLILQEDGLLWVNDFEPFGRPSRGWFVFGPDGAMLAEVVLPLGARLLDVGARDAWIVRRNELGVEQLELLEVSWPW